MYLLLINKLHISEHLSLVTVKESKIHAKLPINAYQIFMSVFIPLHLSHPGPGILVELVLLLRLELLDNTTECSLAGTTPCLRIYRSFPTTFWAWFRAAWRVQSAACATINMCAMRNYSGPCDMNFSIKLSDRLTFASTCITNFILLCFVLSQYIYLVHI